MISDIMSTFSTFSNMVVYVLPGSLWTYQDLWPICFRDLSSEITYGLYYTDGFSESMLLNCCSFTRILSIIKQFSRESFKNLIMTKMVELVLHLQVTLTTKVLSLTWSLGYCLGGVLHVLSMSGSVSFQFWFPPT